MHLITNLQNILVGNCTNKKIFIFKGFRRLAILLGFPLPTDDHREEENGNDDHDHDDIYNVDNEVQEVNEDEDDMVCILMIIMGGDICGES